MKKTICITLSFCIFLVGNIFSQKKVEQGIKQITPELLKQYIDYLASDSMKGRNTPSRELDLAADYIANEFELMGVKKVNGSYFQNIPFCSKNLNVNKSYLKISFGQDSKSFNLKTDFTPFEMTADTMVKSSLVFAGYGITAPEYKYDDYKDIDVKGKIVLVMKHEPGEKDSKSPFDGVTDTKYSLIFDKLENAKQHGAIGLLVVTDPLNHIMLTPQGYPWPSLSKFMPQDNIPIEMCVNEMLIPFVQVGDAVIKYLFGSVDSLKKIQKRIDTSNSPLSFNLNSSDCELSTKLDIKNIIAKNVVGFIEGKDSKLKNELLVIGGHYDHVGYMKNHKDGEDYIFNGADDNASGTAGVMVTAKAFASMKVKPKRSILFILFAGEEKGLYGSKYYCDNPLFSTAKTVAMLNMDMIGRNGNDSIELEGVLLNPALNRIIVKENRKVGLKVVDPTEDMYARSDHYNFYKKGISSMGFTSGLHKDYHTVRDNPNVINHFKVAQITKLAFRTAWFVANDKKYYSIVKKKK
ncbi:MAG: M20/M25/M40 family metallo-hydrolase [Bacteroidales bacterium]|nr:MAG: M20/M25/M40 family metallo-hydrolase [Bacteroidales bacterium]